MALKILLSVIVLLFVWPYILVEHEVKQRYGQKAEYTLTVISVVVFMLVLTKIWR